MWLLFVFLLIQPVVCLYHDVYPQTFSRKHTVAEGRHWRDVIGERRNASFVDRDGGNMETIPMLHFVRLAGIVLMVAQISFLVYFKARTAGEETEAMRQKVFFQLVDTPRFAYKNMKKEYAEKLEKERQEKQGRIKLSTEPTATTVTTVTVEEKKGEEPKPVSTLVLVPKKKKKKKEIEPKVVTEEEPKKREKDSEDRQALPDDLMTAVEKKGSPPKRRRPPPSGEQSQRYPRAKKGHQTKFLEEMEDFLLGDEARELEKSDVSDQMKLDPVEKERDSAIEKGERRSNLEREKGSKMERKKGSKMEREKEAEPEQERRSKLGREKEAKGEKGSKMERKNNSDSGRLPAL